MIIMLDDLAKARYKKLAAIADELRKLSILIKFKQRYRDLLSDLWASYLELRLPKDADKVYSEKHAISLELQKLELREKDLKAKVMQGVSNGHKALDS